MKTVTHILAASTLALGAVCVHLYCRANIERESARTERSARVRQEVEIGALERERVELQRDLRALRRRAATDWADCASVTPGRAARPPDGTAEYAAAAPGFEIPPNAGVPEGLRRLGALRTYGDLARELNLSPTETDQLIDLIVEQEQGPLSADLGSPVDPKQLRQHLEELEKNKEAAIADFLGPDKAEKYRTYRSSLNQRAELRMIREHLDVLRVPLQADQRDKLLAIMLEEQQRSAVQPVAARSDEGYREELQRAQADTRRRIQERAASVLDPEQRQRLEEYYAMQSALMAQAGP